MGSGVDSQGDVPYVSYWWLCLLPQTISAVCCCQVRDNLSLRSCPPLNVTDFGQ